MNITNERGLVMWQCPDCGAWEKVTERGAKIKRHCKACSLRLNNQCKAKRRARGYKPKCTMEMEKKTIDPYLKQVRLSWYKA